MCYTTLAYAHPLSFMYTFTCTCMHTHIYSMYTLISTCMHTHMYSTYTLISNACTHSHTAPAVRLANLLACSGSKNSVKILKGGYERFSAEYPFLRTQKIMYTPLVNDKLLVEN